jgi:hypothetical protein
VALDIRSLDSIYAIEEEVDRLAGMMSGQNPETNVTLMVALEIRALRWALVGAPVARDGDSAVETISKMIDQI